MRTLKYCFIIIILIIPIFSYAQSVVNVKGEYTYTLPTHISRNEAKIIALEKAKIEAMTKAFGVVVSADNTLITSGDDNNSNTYFHSIGNTSVKGEWLQTTEGPTYIEQLKDGELSITVKISGRAREIIESKIVVSAKVLRNGTEDKFESNTFKDGDDLFISFASPVNGYLSIYLVDQNNTAYCLLPYLSNTEGKTEVLSGKKYTFFTTQNLSREKAYLIDEYNLSCDDVKEYNTLYIIFSPKKFVKSLDTHVDKSRPRQLPFLEFEKWLADLRINRTDVQLIKRTIQISPQ